MDWEGVIEKNREALKRIVAALVAMAGLSAAVASPRVGEDGSARRGDAEPSAEPGEGSSPRTLPRRLHRAVVRLLLPAEAAARRLIVIAARNFVVELPKPRPRKARPDLKAAHTVLSSLGIAIVVSGASIPHDTARKKPAPARPLLLPLLDPLKRVGPPRRRTVPPHAAPRIIFFDGSVPHRLPSPPAPWDQVDATRLGRRLAALASALDDLPGQARRLARWKARRDRALATGRRHRLSPLRVGRACGSRGPRSRRPVHDVDEVLADMHYFAFYMLNPPDTS